MFIPVFACYPRMPKAKSKANQGPRNDEPLSPGDRRSCRLPRSYGGPKQRGAALSLYLPHCRLHGTSATYKASPLGPPGASLNLTTATIQQRWRRLEIEASTGSPERTRTTRKKSTTGPFACLHLKLDADDLRKIYTLTAASCMGAFLYGYDSGVMGGVLALESFQRSFRLYGLEKVDLANHSGETIE